MPSYEPVVRNEMDFKTRTLLEPFWVALSGDECVGFVSLDGKPDQPVIHFDSSVVSRIYRNRGIGLALAARAVAWAKNQGFAEVNDGGAKANLAHIKIVERLGFELEPDWVTYEKVL
jgi:GNAT superfamily N-acetyltransferase